MPDALVSILIPSHNAEPWLADTLESALAQSWSNTEIIVVDDGSTDGSRGIAERYVARGVRPFSQANRGASAARNRALYEAKGEWIQFLDADDLLAPDKIAIQMKRLSAHETGFVASAAWARFRQDPAEAVFVDEPNHRDLSGVDFLLLHYEAGWMMQPAAWLAPRALLDEIGPWDETLTLNDDGEYFGRAILAAKGILHCPGARSYYRSEIDGSLSRRADTAAMDSLYRSTSQNLDRLLARVSDGADRAVVADAWLTLAFECYPRFPELARAAESRAKSLHSPLQLRRVPPRVQRLARFIGWRAARRAQLLFRG